MEESDERVQPSDLKARLGECEPRVFGGERRGLPSGFPCLKSGDGCGPLLEVRHSFYSVGSNTDGGFYGSHKISMINLRAPLSRMLAPCVCNDLLLEALCVCVCATPSEPRLEQKLAIQ